MIKYNYDFELITMSTMFLNSMSDIMVKRFNVHKEARDQIKTRIVYAPKQRVLNDLLDKDQNIQLPVISCYIGGIARDQGRVFNKILGTFHTPSKSTSSTNEKGPLPVDVTYNVSIMTRYQQDMDQILSHILPYVNPYFTVSWRTPNRPDFEIRSNVFWNGSVNVQYPFDIVATQVARCVADLSFVFKGWMFQNPEEVGNILNVNANFVNNIAGIPIEYLLETPTISGSNENQDTIIYKFSPPQPKVVVPYSAQIGEIKQFDVWGAGFERITNVYLSGAPLSNISTLQNPFSSSSLSADYAPFTAVKLLTSEWFFDRDSYMTFAMPSATSAGYVDIVVENSVGYGTLTQNVRHNDYNPYKYQSQSWDDFVPYQMRYSFGIQILEKTALLEPPVNMLLDGIDGHVLQETSDELNVDYWISNA